MTTHPVWDTVKLVPPSITWFLPLIRILVVTIPLTFGLCLFNLLVKFVTSRIQRYQLVQQCYPFDVVYATSQEQCQTYLDFTLFLM